MGYCMEVSIIVPIYKVENYLSECISSIINQTYTQVQIILVDDGSPDRCGEICDEFAESDSRILVIHKANGGLSDARNAGMRAATGKYILFLDSDDYLEENAVSELLEFSKKNDLDILMFDAVSFDDSKTHISDDLKNKYIAKNTYSGRYAGADLFKMLVDNSDYRSPVQYFFFNREFLQSANLSFHYGILHEDEEFTFLALLYAKRIMHLPKVLYHHRFRSDSIMGVRFRKANTDSIYKIIASVTERYAFFTDEKDTSSAYIKGIARLAKCFMDARECSEDKNCKDTKIQFKKIKRFFVKRRFFDEPYIEKMFSEYKKRHSIYSKLKHFVFSNEFTKKLYFSVKHIFKR